MKVLKLAFIGLMGALLIAVPAVAEAHGGFGWGVGLGLGLGLLTGWAFAPGPVYAVPYGAPPVHYSPPPAVYRYNPVYYYPPPAPPPPGSYGNTGSSQVSSSTVPPAGQSKCREWRMINRRWENRWDSYSGSWRAVLVEKWGWVEVPCKN
ncbi:MAG: hypothetical protein ACM3N7_01990 [Planctomycetaceae bacterium]